MLLNSQGDTIAMNGSKNNTSDGLHEVFLSSNDFFMDQLASNSPNEVNEQVCK